MKVALLLCPSWDAQFPTYALAALSAQLRRRGHEPAVFDLNLAVKRLDALGPAAAKVPASAESPHADLMEDSTEPYEDYFAAVADRVVSEGHRVAAFQLFLTNVGASARLARMIKERDPGVTVVFGGSECLTFERCRHYAGLDGVDAVLYGEADASFPRLVDEVAREGRPRRGRGVLLRGDEAGWKDEQEPVEDLDALPFADYGGHRLGAYRGKSLHTCRGCVRRCVFCSEWRVRAFRRMSPERVHAEVLHQLDRDPGVRTFLFADSLVNGDLRGLEAFCDRVTADGLRIDWNGYAIVRPDMTRACCDKLARSGCGELFFGIESGSDKVLAAVAKGTTAAWNARALEDARAAGIRTAAGWLVGFPTETESDFQDSLAFMAAHGRHISRLDPNLFTIEELGADWDRYGLTPTRQATYWRTRDGRNTFPVRVDRFRRLVKTALEQGVQVYWEGLAPERFDARLDAMLEKYERGEARGAWAAA
ncbi:MAG: radical SAM protein [Elusimicrobiota bacterium]|nr:radical SAM protein [Elusimicrobiota bacterium]